MDLVLQSTFDEVKTSPPSAHPHGPDAIDQHLGLFLVAIMIDPRDPSIRDTSGLDIAGEFIPTNSIFECRGDGIFVQMHHMVTAETHRDPP